MVGGQPGAGDEQTPQAPTERGLGSNGSVDLVPGQSARRRGWCTAARRRSHQGVSARARSVKRSGVRMCPAVTDQRRVSVAYSCPALPSLHVFAGWGGSRATVCKNPSRKLRRLDPSPATTRANSLWPPETPIRGCFAVCGDVRRNPVIYGCLCPISVQDCSSAAAIRRLDRPSWSSRA